MPFLLRCAAIGRWQLNIATVPADLLVYPIVAQTSWSKAARDAFQQVGQAAMGTTKLPGDEKIPLGSSKAGGFADLPKSWVDAYRADDATIPRLLMQLNFADLRGFSHIASKLPQNGIFYVLSQAKDINDGAEAFTRVYCGPCKNLDEELVRVAPSCFAPTLPQLGGKDSGPNTAVIRRCRDANSDQEYDVISLGPRYVVNGVVVFRPCRLTFSESVDLPRLGEWEPGCIGSDGLDPAEDGIYDSLADIGGSGIHSLFGFGVAFQRNHEGIFQSECVWDDFLDLLEAQGEAKIKEILKPESDLRWLPRKADESHAACQEDGLLKVRQDISNLFKFPVAPRFSDVLL